MFILFLEIRVLRENCENWKYDFTTKGMEIKQRIKTRKMNIKNEDLNM